MTELDASALRRRLEGPITKLAPSSTHNELDQHFQRLGLVEPPGEGRTKAQRVAAVFGSLDDCDLEQVAKALLSSGLSDAADRNAIEDALWAGRDFPLIQKRTRREIAADLDLGTLVVDAERFTRMLDRLWVLGGESFLGIFGGTPTFGEPPLRQRIERHVFRNPGDWSAEKLFDELGAFDASDRRFGLFLEGLVSHEVLVHEPNQRAVLATINPHLHEVQLELRETTSDGGYPVFRLCRVGDAPARRPKNLIFASSKKPDLRLSDALDNDIEILDSEADVLVYDEPIGDRGLRWRDLQIWWSRTHPDQSDTEVKRALYARLLRSLPDNSPPQQNLFLAYHHIFQASIPDLPALLPEVWLHWDHKTVSQRGTAALLNFRMDFLLLLPGHRIVLEVDGKQHYTDDCGHASPARYADNVRADRDMKLCGYDVFRFGAHELRTKQHALPLLTEFFDTLFARYGVTTE
ncbi:hypothetical protein A6411_16595 [Prescottella equi]|uniref:AbiJ-related protein n=1 Tax=Rhodococcus hoagii TaxID=43767 RepID=UPI0009C0B2F9|nr:hypothetical protein [Prescottella equi]NKS84111.1 hypothetical protein [Prescottella equi]OQQ27501.1 hypothetical protein A6411_16595 [Prescottella equi]